MFNNTFLQMQSISHVNYKVLNPPASMCTYSGWKVVYRKQVCILCDVRACSGLCGKMAYIYSSFQTKDVF